MALTKCESDGDRLLEETCLVCDGSAMDVAELLEGFRIGDIISHSGSKPIDGAVLAGDISIKVELSQSVPDRGE
jgi:hypothetical protein